MTINMTLVMLVFSLLVVVYLIYRIQKIDTKNKMSAYFEYLNVLLVIYLIGLILQIIFSKTTINPMYFDFITYTAVVFVPVVVLAISQEYAKSSKIKLKYLMILPVISLLILWTNDFHNLFYEKYSTIISEVKYGPYFYVYMIYSYGLLVVSFIKLIISSTRKSGFLTFQTGLIILGVVAPVLPNALGTFKIIDMSIYITPIMFTVTAICFYIAIIKLKALNVIPVTLRTVIDNMTDSFIVLSEDGTIVDVNKTCVDKFEPIIQLKSNDNLYSILESNKASFYVKLKKDLQNSIDKRSTVTEEYHVQKGDFDKYFNVDIQPIKAKHGNEYVAILLLIRDITQEKKDIEIMTKNENLVILGELAGGVAHDINTPISAIKSGITMLKPLSRSEDETMLLNSMDSCADKIIALVNSLRNQIRNIGSDEVTDISITNVLEDIKLILNNELKKNSVELVLNIEEDIHIKGNSTKLSQVIINIVTNAIQAYDGKGGRVEVIVKEEKELAKICIADYASGIPERVRPYIFKNILTTKGVSGTGFGLYLAYSVIKGAFGGDITFKTQTGKGTTFEIDIPLT